MTKKAIGLAVLVAGAMLARFVPAQESPPAPAGAQAPPAAAGNAAPAPGAPSSSSGAPSSAAPPAAGTPPTPRSAGAGAAAPRTPTRPADDVFIPSEEIQADEEITFPIDI